MYSIAFAPQILGDFKTDCPKGHVISTTGVFDSIDTYSCNPNGNLDPQARPNPDFLKPKYISAMLRVVSLGDKWQAPSMSLLREKKQLKLLTDVMPKIRDRLI
jgi:hypothetical protein